MIALTQTFSDSDTKMNSVRYVCRGRFLDLHPGYSMNSKRLLLGRPIAHSVSLFPHCSETALDTLQLTYFVGRMMLGLSGVRDIHTRNVVFGQMQRDEVYAGVYISPEFR